MSENNTQDPISQFAQRASGLGKVAAEIAGVIHDVTETAKKQTVAFSTLSQDVAGMTKSNGGIVQAVQATAQEVKEMHVTVDASLQKAKDLETSVKVVEKGIIEVNQSLRGVSDAANEISKIAFQTRLVAFNASVEAVRAGEAGRGFSVVAQAVKDLADKVQVSSQEITSTIRTLTNRVKALEASMGGQDGIDGSLDGQSVVDEAIRVFQTAMDSMESQVQTIQHAATDNSMVCSSLLDQFRALTSDVQNSAGALQEADKRVDSLLGMSEELIGITAESGIETIDTPYIHAVLEASKAVAQKLEEAVQSGMCQLEDLFDEQYKPVAGTNPQQFTTRFCDLTDRLLPAIQEAMIEAFPKAAFCAAVDRNGYLPTHNNKYSQRQRPNDPVWNAANCRNRRLFNDRTGLSAGRNRKTFLLQTYRRDMGGGKFVVMKDLSAPIVIFGRHWGGLRLGYAVD